MTLFYAYNVPTFMIIVSLCIAHRKKNWFLLNRARIYQYKQVYKITRFARLHKSPVQRSAFTYCEDEMPTGLDLAKTKYGGPYTTEDVENVKAFYGILKILLSVCPVFFNNLCCRFFIVIGMLENFRQVQYLIIISLMTTLYLL